MGNREEFQARQLLSLLLPLSQPLWDSLNKGLRVRGAMGLLNFRAPSAHLFGDFSHVRDLFSNISAHLLVEPHGMLADHLSDPGDVDSVLLQLFWLQAALINVQVGILEHEFFRLEKWLAGGGSGTPFDRLKTRDHEQISASLILLHLAQIVNVNADDSAPILRDLWSTPLWYPRRALVLVVLFFWLRLLGPTIFGNFFFDFMI